MVKHIMTARCLVNAEHQIAEVIFNHSFKKTHSYTSLNKYGLCSYGLSLGNKSEGGLIFEP
jgi:hypothetical protein